MKSSIMTEDTRLNSSIFEGDNPFMVKKSKSKVHCPSNHSLILRNMKEFFF